MAESSTPFDLIISGAGPVGSSLALALEKKGLKVALIERRSFQEILASDQDIRALALSAASLRFLDKIHIWPLVRDASEDILDIHVTNGDAPFTLHFGNDPKQSAGNEAKEAMGAITPAYQLRHACIKRIQETESVTVFENAEITHLDSGKQALAQVTLSTGETLKTSLVVAADGHRSHTRALCGVEPTVRSYGQEALITVVSHDKPHDGLAYERFYSGGPFATLPMTHNRSGIVWIADPAEISYLKNCEEELFVSLIQERYPDVSVRALEAPRTSYPLTLKFLETLYHGRTVFLGDAAHAIHPLAGQSLNLGFRDVTVLAEEIESAVSVGLDIGSETILSRYQQKRRFDTFELITATHGLNALFSTQTPLLKSLRGVGLRLFSALPGAARYATRHAMGLTGRISKFHQ